MLQLRAVASTRDTTMHPSHCQPAICCSCLLCITHSTQTAWTACTACTAQHMFSYKPAHAQHIAPVTCLCTTLYCNCRYGPRQSERRFGFSDRGRLACEVNYVSLAQKARGKQAQVNWAGHQMPCCPNDVSLASAVTGVRVLKVVCSHISLALSCTWRWYDTAGTAAAVAQYCQ
jgi:hypothetical protein